MQEKIEIEYQNEIHTGHISVEGTNKKRLVVYYRGRKRVDSYDSRAEQPGYIESFAKQLLLEMVKDEYDKLSQEIEAKDE